ncbi:hypothetical protein GCM10020229_60240 [Kitasatospora albolonga]
MVAAQPVPSATEDPGPEPLPPGQVRAVVDLSSFDVRVNGTDAARPCSVGGPGSPTPSGRMTVISRQAVVVMDSQTGPFLTVGDKSTYHLELNWAVKLSAPDGTSVWIAEMPWRAPGSSGSTAGGHRSGEGGRPLVLRAGGGRGHGGGAEVAPGARAAGPGAKGNGSACHRLTCPELTCAAFRFAPARRSRRSAGPRAPRGPRATVGVTVG